MSSNKDLDNKANQLNTNNDAFYKSRGQTDRPDNWKDGGYTRSTNPTKSDLDNHANQRNPNHQEYDHSREAGKK